MRTRTTIRLAALSCGVLFLAALVVGLVALPASGSGDAGHHGAHNAKPERFLYVSTIAQSATDPDFIAVIGADPRQPDFGKIVNRIDMPNVGDELHHYGYSHDQKRLLVPGLFSSRIHVFDIKGDGKRWRSERSTTSWRRRAATSSRTASWPWPRQGAGDHDRGRDRHDPARRHRRDRRQDGRVPRALRSRAGPRARASSARSTCTTSSRCTTANRGDQHDVRPAGAVRRRHRADAASAARWPSGTSSSGR